MADNVGIYRTLMENYLSALMRPNEMRCSANTWEFLKWYLFGERRCVLVDKGGLVGLPFEDAVIVAAKDVEDEYVQSYNGSDLVCVYRLPTISRDGLTSLGKAA